MTSTNARNLTLCSNSGALFYHSSTMIGKYCLCLVRSFCKHRNIYGDTYRYKNTFSIKIKLKKNVSTHSYANWVIEWKVSYICKKAKTNTFGIFKLFIQNILESYISYKTMTFFSKQILLDFYDIFSIKIGSKYSFFFL